MAKLTLKDPGANYRSNSQIKSNNDKIEAAIENTLSRDGTAPNQMEANLDMNGYEILNTVLRDYGVVGTLTVTDQLIFEGDLEVDGSLNLTGGLTFGGGLSFEGDLDLTGDITITGTVDGRDLSTDGAKLDGIEASADVTDAANVESSGATMESFFSGTGLVSRTGAKGFATRAVSLGSGLTGTNLDGVAGNPSISFDAGPARTALGLVVGTDVFAYDANLQGFVDALTLPTTDGTDGQVLTTNGSGNLTFESFASADVIKSDVTYQIPTDYATLQAAFNAIGAKSVAPGVAITVNIATGHSPTSGVYLEGGDWSNVTITSTDAVVDLASSFPVEGSVIEIVGGHAPTLSCLFDGGGLYGRNGYYLRDGSTGRVTSGAGVRNLGGTGTDPKGAGLFCNVASRVSAKDSVFSGNGLAVWVTKGSQADCEGANLSGSTGDSGIFVSRASSLHMSNADASGATGDAIKVFRSRVVALGSANFSSAGGHGILAAQGSNVVADARSGLVPNITSCGDNGIEALSGSFVSAVGANISSNSKRGIDASGGSTVYANSATITNNGTDGVLCTASYVHVNGATITGSVTDIDIGLSEGGTVYANGVITSSGGGTSPVELADTNVSRLNAITSQGVLWATDDYVDAFVVNASAPAGSLEINADGSTACTSSDTVFPHRVVSGVVGSALSRYNNSAGEAARIGYDNTIGGAVIQSTRSGQNVFLISGTSGTVNVLRGLPTSATGLGSGDLWNDSGTVKIVT